uniref:NR LBD domain-containing protein n=1 Tax=Caenorhabditis tropicalis TaxID=1561998 RepID=A0A1I7THG4_9PELO
MSEQRDYLKSVLDQLTVKNNAQPDPGRFMSEFSRIYSQIDKKHLNDDLDVFYKNFSTYDQAIETFFEQLRHAGSIGKDEVKDQNGFVYGILAIKPVKDNYKFFFEGLENYCSARYEEDRIHGFDTVIARMPFNHSVYTEKYANLWRMKQLNKEKKNIETIIAREMEYVSLFFSMMIENCRNLYLEPSLPQIADTLKNKFGPDFISEDKFHDNA